MALSRAGMLLTSCILPSLHYIAGQSAYSAFLNSHNVVIAAAVCHQYVERSSKSQSKVYSTQEAFRLVAGIETINQMSIYCLRLLSNCQLHGLGVHISSRIWYSFHHTRLYRTRIDVTVNVRLIHDNLVRLNHVITQPRGLTESSRLVSTVAHRFPKFDI